MLRLCERFEQPLVEPAVARALEMGAISAQSNLCRLRKLPCIAVKVIALARIERRPLRLDLQLYPHLPRADVGRSDPGAYMGLLSQTEVSAAGVTA